MRKLITLSACLLALVYSVACAKLDEEARAQRTEQKLYRAGIIKLPDEERYSIGDTYTYDNPQTTWQITDIIGDRLLWESELGERMETSTNPFLPALAWESKRYGQGRRNITQIRGSLFPLKKGKTMKFVESSSFDGKRRSLSWRCVVGDKQKTNTPAGIFDTFAVLCQRINGESLVYKYSPALARIVEFQTPALGLAPLVKRSLISYASSAGVVYQQTRRVDGIEPQLEPLPLEPGEQEATPYIPELVPINPLPFAQPPADFFAPQLDSKPKQSTSEKTSSNPLKRILEEELRKQNLQKVPVLPQFAPAPSQNTEPQESGSQGDGSQGDGSQGDGSQESGSLESESAPLKTPQESSSQTTKESSPESETASPQQTQPNSNENNSSNATKDAPKNTTSAVRLGEYPSLSQARQEWQKLSGEFATLFSGRRYDIIRRNDAAQGIVYALYAHPYINNEAAQDVCDSIRKKYRRSNCGTTAWKKK